MTRQRSRLSLPCAVLLGLVALHTAGQAGALDFSAGPRLARRAWLASAIPAAAAGLGWAPSARAELSPPLARAVGRYAEQLQGGMDVLYFDVQNYVRGGTRLFQQAVNLVDNSAGSNTAIDRDLLTPLRQFVLAGEEDGEVDFKPSFERIETAARGLQLAARDQQIEDAITLSDSLIAELGKLFLTINKEAEKPVFMLPTDSNYDSREQAYRRRMAEGKQKNLMRKDGEQL